MVYQIIYVGGVRRAVIGLNGRSSSVDQVYVATTTLDHPLDLSTVHQPRRGRAGCPMNRATTSSTSGRSPRHRSTRM
jgi:hypothetical protein